MDEYMGNELIALWTEMSSDPELIAGVRAGDSAAFGVLYERHATAARKVAAQYTNTPADIDDVVSESFSRVLRALQQGDGPDLAFRAYLFTIVRRTGMDLINKGIRTRPRDDMSPYESALGYEASSDEPALANFEQGLVADAFTSLPERWQAVLWYTEVEKKSPKEIAPLLGLSANGVAALSYRAREALRQAYLQQHLATAGDVDCLEANAQLGAFVRGGLNKRESSRVDEHVRTCAKCAALVAELEDVNRGMRGIIAPLVLGAAGVAALEGGLPIGGVLGTATGGGAAAGSGTGATVGAGGAGTSGVAAAGAAAVVAAGA
ncbi:sigma-70 family RNA polymerase sigma factor, partial [Demequina sp.]|uniref:sigma-70 family RNA polymerase sigma factor n=1 Tax=Demequina sp. TaxID=2050685 RepID=UPI0025C0F352